MKLSSVTFTNYKSFVKAKANFHKWVNIITGPSDSGKSAIVHGINLVANNVPRSTSYRTKRTERTEVQLTGENTSISRIKTDKLNQYIVKVNNKIVGKPKAIKADVPEIISKTLRLSEINFQLQKNPFFLINISPGKRSKLLNKVANLSVIDNSIKAINSEIRKLDTKTDTLIEQEKELGLFLKDTEWVHEADTKLLEIEKLQKSIELDTNRLENIKSIYSKLKQEKRLLDELIPNECIIKVKNICALYLEIDEDEFFIEQILDSYEELQKLQKEYSQIETIDVSKLTKLAIELDTDKKLLSRIQSITNELKTLKTAYDDSNKKLNITLAKISKMKICPTCGSMLNV